MTPQDWETTELTRRKFLGLTAAGTAALLGSAWAEEAFGAVDRMVERLELEKELNVLNWGGYIDFAIKPFQKRYGVKVNIEHYGGETEAFAKVKANPGRFDTFNVGVGYLQPAVAQGLVQPIDVSKIPSYKNSYPQFQPGPFRVNGKIYGVDYAWGTNALAYNTKLAPKKVTSWAAFWDPAFKGKTSLVDKPRDQFLATALYLGTDFNHPKVPDRPRIKKAMIERAQNMRTLWSTGDDLQRFMVQGDVILADCYDGLGFQINAKDKDIIYAIPSEGTYGWFDGPELLAHAPHPNAAYAWINFVTSTPIELLVAKVVNYSPGDSRIPRLLSPGLRHKLNLDQPAAVISKLKFWEPLGPEWEKWIGDSWAEAKAS